MKAFRTLQALQVISLFGCMGIRAEPDSRGSITTREGSTISFDKIAIHGDKLTVETSGATHGQKLALNDATTIAFHNPFECGENPLFKVTLINKDVLYGNIDTVDKEHLTIKSACGTFRVATMNVSKIFRVLDKSEFKRHKDLNCNGYYVSPADVPDKADLVFVLRSPNRGEFRLALNLFSNTYLLSIDDFKTRFLCREPDTAALSASERGCDYRELDATEHRPIVAAARYVMSVNCDKTKGIFTLSVNGVHTHTFKDPSGFQGKGNGFYFWNTHGTIDFFEVRKANQASEIPDEYLADLNWRVYPGHVNNIRDNKIQLKDNTFELDKINVIAFRDIDEDAAKQTEATLILKNKARLKARDISLSGDKLTINHAYLGRITFDVDDLHTISIFLTLVRSAVTYPADGLSHDVFACTREERKR